MNKTKLVLESLRAVAKDIVGCLFLGSMSFIRAVFLLVVFPYAVWASYKFLKEQRTIDE